MHIGPATTGGDTSLPDATTASHPLADAGRESRFLGLSRHPGTGHAKRPGEIWMVFHDDWTGIYRLDPRDRRTVFLERALNGDRRNEGIDWALETFAIDRVEERVRFAA